MNSVIETVQKPLEDRRFDRDVFQYSDTVLRQCISGAGRNAKIAIDEGEFDTAKFYIDEFVRWTQDFNEHTHELESLLSLKEKELEAVRIAAGAFFTELHFTCDSEQKDKLEPELSAFRSALKEKGGNNGN